MARFFETVVSAGDAPRKKPHPDPLLLALGRMGLAPDETAYVGDSPEDVLMAKAAGALAVGVPGGFPNHAALAATAPDHLATSLEDAVRRLLA